MFTVKERQSFRCRSSGGSEWHRSLSVACLFILLAGAAGQDAATNQPPGQAGSTNAAPVQGGETPDQVPPSVPEVNAQNGLTNQAGVLPTQPVAPLAPLAPSGPGSGQPPSPIMGTSALACLSIPAAGAAFNPGLPLGGPFSIKPHVLYTFLYGNGIEAQPGVPSKTAINTIAPGFLFDIGQHWSIDYTPSLSFYSNPAFKNTVDESATLAGNWAAGNWTFGLSQQYVSSTDPLIETGAQTKEESYATALNATYEMGSKLSLQLAVNQNFRDAGALSDLHEWTTSDWLNYQANDMFGAAIGVILGYDELDPGSDMPFEQLQGRIHFHPGPKLTLTLSGGVEDRQFIDPSAPPLISPIFSGTLAYQLFQPTTLSVNASRTVTPSLFNNEVEVITSVNGSVAQQLTPKFSLNVGGGYTTEPLTSIVPGPLPQYFIGTPPQTTLAEIRTDTITSFKISLLYQIVPRCTLSVYYTYLDNSSGQGNFSYTSKQIGFSADYRY